MRLCIMPLDNDSAMTFFVKHGILPQLLEAERLCLMKVPMFEDSLESQD